MTQYLSLHTSNLAGMAVRILMFAIFGKIGVFDVLNVVLGICVTSVMSFILYNIVVSSGDWLNKSLKMFFPDMAAFHDKVIKYRCSWKNDKNINKNRDTSFFDSLSLSNCLVVHSQAYISSRRPIDDLVR